MARPRLEVAEVIQSCRDAFLEQYGAGLTPVQRRALDDLTACRTAALGGHVLGCLECGHQEISYNSCGNRHCPKCQGRTEWVVYAKPPWGGPATVLKYLARYTHKAAISNHRL